MDNEEASSEAAPATGATMEPEAAAPTTAAPAGNNAARGSSAEQAAPEAGKRKLPILASVLAVRKDRQALKAEIASLTAALATATAALEAARAEVAQLRQEAANHASEREEFEATVAALEEEARTVEAAVAAELEGIGIPEAAAPEAMTEADAETVEELEARMEREPDMHERGRIYLRIREKERAA